jgi:Bacterial TniB protein
VNRFAAGSRRAIVEGTYPIPTTDTAVVSQRKSDGIQGQLAHSGPIHHRAFRDALRSIADLHFRTVQSGRGSGILLVGQSGSGKTELMKYYKEQHIPAPDAEPHHIPILFVATPARPTVKNLAATILHEIGDPLANRGTESEKTVRLLNFLERCKVELILIDELQHFWDHRGPATFEVTDWLKNLLDASRKAIVLSGLPRSAQVVQQNNQMRRRFARSVTLAPFSAATESDWLEFLAVLDELHERLPVDAPSFYEPQIASRFLHATAGLIDYLCRLIACAVELSQRRRRPVDWPMLADAFRIEIWTNAPDSLNPFLARDEKLRPLRGKGEPFEHWDDHRI